MADFSAMPLPAARALAATRLQAIDGLKQGMSRRRSSCPTMETFFFKTFLTLVETQSRSYETHASIYRNHLQQLFGGLRLDDITEEAVLEFNSSLATKRVAFKNAGSRTLAEGTIKRIMILLRHILNEAIRRKGNTLTHNPTHVLKLKTVRKIKGKFQTRDQLKALLKAAGESLNRDLPDIIRVMGTTGLPRENVLAMRWEWFDAARGTLSIPAENDKAKKGFVLRISSDVRQLLQDR